MPQDWIHIRFSCGCTTLLRADGLELSAKQHARTPDQELAWLQSGTCPNCQEHITDRDAQWQDAYFAELHSNMAHS